MFWSALWLLLGRALRLRCPVCGKSPMMRDWFHVKERCSACGHVFEREEGYFTGAMALNLVITEGVVAVVVLPATLLQAPIIPVIAVAILGSVGLPLLAFPYARALWIVIDLLLHPLEE
jgi:uncharacterized protein (DUF983 family)